MKNKKKYKFSSGIQQIAMDTPDYSKAYDLQAEEGAKNQGIQNALGTFAGQYKGVADLANVAGSAIKSRSKGKGGAQLGGAVATGGAAGAAGFNKGNKIVPGLGGLIGAGVGMTAGAIYGGIKGGKEYTKGKALQAEADRQAEWDNYNKGFNINGSATDAQARVAKNGKYKVKTKQPRMIETEGREPIFSPKKADGTRDLLYYNPNDPTHEEGGVKAVVMPKNRYNNGTSNLMPRRSKVSLLDSGNMAVGSKQLKVNTLNDTALSNNLTGIPAANAANKFIQPMAGINQVARNIPEARRKEKQNTPRSHKKSYKQPIEDPPMLYEMKRKPPLSRSNKETLSEPKLPKPRSTYNTKNDFKKGGKYVKVYAEGSKGVSLAFSRGEKDPKGGLTQKGVDKYNRATGGNLKMAVTTPPSKLKAGSKAANRRKSFCARMSGVKGPMAKNGKPTRKALALRKWNC